MTKFIRHVYPRLAWAAFTKRAFLVLFVSLAFFPLWVGAADRIPIKMIVLAGYEAGNDLGDEPCEFQLWVERDHLFM